MKNRFNINEEEKNRIRDLHGMQVINEQDQRKKHEDEQKEQRPLKEQKRYMNEKKRKPKVKVPDTKYTTWCKEHGWEDGVGQGCADDALDSEDYQMRSWAIGFITGMKEGKLPKKIIREQATHKPCKGCRNQIYPILKNMGHCTNFLNTFVWATIKNGHATYDDADLKACQDTITNGLTRYFEITDKDREFYPNATEENKALLGG